MLREWDQVWVRPVSRNVHGAVDRGTRRHIRGALEAGASREEFLMILKIASLLALHTCSLGAPILLEEAKAAGVKQGPAQTSATPVCDKMT
jgi:hypothetical protein